MDFLSDILQTIKLRGTVYFHARLQSPWGVKIPSGQYANYHIVTDGQCWVESECSQKPILLRKGDVVLFPHGACHSLVDSLQSDIVSPDELINNPLESSSDELVLGGDGPYSASLICGHFEYDREFPHPLFETLPPLLYIPAKNTPSSDWFTKASELTAQISKGDSMGKEAVVNRLAESIFIQTLADYVKSMDDSSGFLGAIQDRNIGLALRSIHNDIAYDWNIQELAKIAAMSKSVFSAKFHHLVGEPPIIYLARWRMLKAREMLTDTNFSIKQISEKVGYKSEFSFSKAFKKNTGLAPGAIRKQLEI